MTQDEIIDIANEMAFMASIWIEDDSNEFKDMITFAKLVAAKEREACAKVADGWSKRDDDVGAFIGKAIRARGEA